MNKNNKIFICDTKPYDKRFFNEANKSFGFEIKYFSGHLNQDTVELAKGYKTVCAFVNDIIDKDVIDCLVDQGVKLIALRCAGYNNVDLKAAYQRIKVVRVPGYSPYAVAEHAVALMMGLNRNIHKAYYRTRDGNFAINGLMGFDMFGKTAGVIGTGLIGRCLINILKGFGMRVLAYDKYPNQNYAEKTGIEYIDLDELYRQSDIISLHCPLTAETRHMINKESIDKMKSGVMIINTSRGKLIKTDALINGLKSGKISAAGLDVYEEESEYFFEDFSSSMIDDDVLARLLTFSNVLITSHQGFFTREAMKNISEITLKNIQAFIHGDALENEVCYQCQD